MIKEPVSAAANSNFAWNSEIDFTPPVNTHRTHSGESSASVSRANNLGPLLDEFLETIVDTVGASAGVIRIQPLNSPTLHTISSIGMPEELPESEYLIEFDCETRGKAGIAQEIYSSDLSICTTRSSCFHPACVFKSAITIPLESRTPLANPIGIITLFFNTSQDHSHKAYSTVQAFAKILSACIEHIKANREFKRADRMAARQAIANDIHDSLAQTLAYTRMRTSLLSEAIRSDNKAMATTYAQDIEEGLEHSQKTARELIRDFRCEIDPAGLLPALQTLTEKFDERNELSLEYTNRVVDLELPLEYEIEVLYIVSEALTNISKHSGATHARLLIDYISGYYIFTIEDNGSGGVTFSPVEGHYGMMIMRERAQRIGGEIKMESSQGGGTRVRLFFPEPLSDWRATNE